MTVKMLGVPQLSLLELTMLADIVGMPFEFLIRSSSPAQVRHYWPKKLTVYTALRVLYVDSMEGYRNYASVRDTDLLVLARVSPTEIIDYGAHLYLDGVHPVTADDFGLFFRSFHSLPDAPHKDKVVDSTAVLLQDKSRESLLSKLQSAFYRVKDKDERSNIQLATYRFLLSKNKTPNTGWDHIDRILTTDLTKRFKEALRQIKMLDDVSDVARNYGIDRFELTFVLKKLNKI